MIGYIVLFACMINYLFLQMELNKCQKMRMLEHLPIHFALFLKSLPFDYIKLISVLQEMK